VQRDLETEPVIWLVTVDVDGTPQPSPVWFHWNRDDQTLLIYSKRGTARERNVRRTSRVALHFNSDREGEQVAIFTGEATIDQSLPPPHAHAEYLEKYRDGMRRIGTTPEQFSVDYPLPIVVRPARLRGF
jgi:PPOX class probable F420-dependent enzyme